MYFNMFNELSVTREWIVSLSLVEGDYFFESAPLKITLDKIKTEWKVVLRISGEKLYACLHRLTASSCDFRVVALFKTPNRHIKKHYDGSWFLDGDWFKLSNHFSNHDEFDVQITLHEKPIYLPYVAQYDKQKEDMLLSESFNDFKFICSDGTTVLANRSILALNSPVFRAMLDTQMLESQTQTVKLEEIDSKTMQEVIRFMYTRGVDDIKTHAINLLYCANKYELRDLKNACVAGIMRNMNTENIIEYLIAAYRYEENDLIRRCLLYIECYSRTIDLSQLQKTDPSLFTIILYLVEKKEEKKPPSFKINLNALNSYAHRPQF